jgi:hypothetical protein
MRSVRRVQQNGFLQNAMKMKLHHTAALALLGWYLMLAPHQSNRSKPFNFDAPLSKWQQGESYDSKAECEKIRRTQVSDRQDKYEAVKSRRTKQVLRRAIDRLQHGQCVAADDLRLKEHP